MKNTISLILIIFSAFQSFGQAASDSIATEQNQPHLYTISKAEDLNIKG
ncbi:hypothetical protein [Dyadobacter fermentans]|nr:hypothetical protein [Dyadobacter fermentans]MBZ1361644.1 hypothetical protein [Dyadobacter fermentans]